MTGTIFDLKRFAVHDGSGLRSTLFLKGCPLHCPWCQNPEGMVRETILWYRPKDCLRCESCVKACAYTALTFTDRLHVDHNACTQCGACVDACPAAALELLGKTVTAQEAARELLRDRIFFGEKGGVTLSGGEVLTQWQFAAEILRLCKEAGVDTAIETCLLAPRQALAAMLPVTDHFIIDIKFMDADLHRHHLGADNRQILQNFEWLIENGASILVRTPLIPGYTATDANIRSIARYLHQIAPQIPYELLNFNPLCRSKYSALEQDYPVSGGALTGPEMEHYYEILAQEGIVHIVKE